VTTRPRPGATCGAGRGTVGKIGRTLWPVCVPSSEHMVTRGELLALVDGAPGRLRTLQGALTTWLDPDAAQAVHAGAGHRPRAEGAADEEPEESDEPPGPRLTVVPAEAPRSESLASWYVAVAPPDRWRVVGRGQIVVSDGRRSWVGTSTLVTERDSARALIHDAGAIGACLYPGPALRGLALGDPEPGEIEGRRCLVVEARPPSGSAVPAHRDLIGIDHRLWFDAGTGIVLRHEGYAGGAACSWAQLSDLVVDALLDDDEFRPPPGAVVRSHHELLRDHLAEMGIDPDSVDLDDPVQVRDALRQGG
jgi:hypothetical protein